MKRSRALDEALRDAATLVDIAKRHLPPHISQGQQAEAYLAVKRIAADHRGAVEDRAALATALSTAVAIMEHAGYENNARTLRAILDAHRGR